MPASPSRGLFARLYRGETKIDFIGPRKRWYAISAVIIVTCIASMWFRGFNFGIEFAGGNQFVLPAKSGTSLSEAREALERAGIEVSTAQEAGTGGQRNYVLKTPELTPEQTLTARKALSTAANVPENEITTSEVSSSWGRDVTRQALIALVVFLILLSAYLWIRFEQKMALAALLALVHDLIFTAGVYSMVGFEVTPASVVGMLTILGYSLYDTVVVFDKVEENVRGILGGTRMTYADAANLAVNQTLMRSINTSLIGLLPVAGLLFVGAGLLGVGTLKDLALVLFVGMATGAYSSLFLATPWLVDLKRLEPRYKAHEKRVLAKRAQLRAAAKAGKTVKGKTAAATEAAPAKKRRPKPSPKEDEEVVEAELADEVDEDAVDAEVDEDAVADEVEEDEVVDEEEEAEVDESQALAGSAPRPGARPPARSGGRGGRSGPRKRSGKGGRPHGGKRRR